MDSEDSSYDEAPQSEMADNFALQLQPVPHLGRLRDLRTALDEGLLSHEEFEETKRVILLSWGQCEVNTLYGKALAKITAEKERLVQEVAAKEHALQQQAELAKQLHLQTVEGMYAHGSVPKLGVGMDANQTLVSVVQMHMSTEERRAAKVAELEAQRAAKAAELERDRSANEAQEQTARLVNEAQEQTARLANEAQEQTARLANANQTMLAALAVMQHPDNAGEELLGCETNITNT